VTDAERQKLLAEAVAHLKLTTVGYYGHSEAWKRNKTTQWWAGLSRIEQVVRDLDPVGPSPVTSGPIVVKVSYSITTKGLKR